MLHKVQECIVAHQLFDTQSKLFVACSGGVDSMVCLDILSKNHYTISGVVHCNFQLRASESDADEKLVRDTAHRIQVPFYTQRFDTEVYAKEHKISIEMAARDLRYAYFEELKKSIGFDYLVTAHHIDDSIETVLMRLISGTGLKGLKGIAPKNQYIVRPLLDVSKEMLYDYAKNESIEYREDASNGSSIYRRNIIRNNLMPIIAELNPNYRHAIGSMMHIAHDQEQLVAHYIQSNKLEWNEDLFIDLNCLATVEFQSIIVAALCTPFELNQTDIINITASLFATESKFFETKKGTLEVKNGHLQVLKTKSALDELLIPKEALTSRSWTFSDQVFQFEIADRAQVVFERGVQYFDLESIRFPLKMRTWRSGDRIKPMGMKGLSKKIQDVFQSKKYSASQKHAAIILEDQDEVIAIVHQIQNERTKVQSEGKVLILRELKK